MTIGHLIEIKKMYTSNGQLWLLFRQQKRVNILPLVLLVSIHYGSELELPHVSRFDSGVYLCIASNGVQPSVSKVVRLYVDCESLLIV